MKTLAAFAAPIVSAQAQTTFTRTYPVLSGQRLSLTFDCPTVTISTWEKNEVSIAAKVRINDDQYDSNFELQAQNKDGVLIISDSIKDFDKLPHQYTIVHSDNKTVYKSRRNGSRRKSGDIKQSYEGTDIDIILEIKVPAHCRTTLAATYGMVEITDFNAPITVNAPYGGIDATINTVHTEKLEATTSYGEIYSNLDMKLTSEIHRDFFNSITAEPGTGSDYIFTSLYGNLAPGKALPVIK